MDKLEKISKQTISRYTNRYEELGYNIKTLGWGTKEQQEYRFFQTLDKNIDFENKIILDIGCGFGDYFYFLNQHNINFYKYIGYDINKNLIRKAQEKNESDKCTFKVNNILSNTEKNIADIGVMLGLLNFNLKDTMDNFEYSKKVMEKAFSLVKEVLIVDFLSIRVDENYAKEDFVYYHLPQDILDFALSLSDNVVLKHNYKAIPQKEFMIFIYKD